MRNALGPRPSSRAELVAWYRAALSAQARSGLSVADYAEEIGVTAATLYLWRRRLTVAGEDAAPDRQAQLVEVTVADEGEAGSGATLVVRMKCRRRSIEVSPGFRDDDLRRLVAVLESC